MAAPVVELRDVRKSFEHHEVLRGVSIALTKGTTLAVMGGSGAGKTVFLRIADGLIRPDAGEVLLFGTPIERMREEAMLPLRRRAGFVFQGAALFDSLSVFENVAYPLREHTRLSEGEIADRVHRFLSLVGLPGTDDLLPAELSGGMRKRVGIARALVMEPEVVFFDEPTAGLDPTNGRLVAELIAELRTGSATPPSWSRTTSSSPTWWPTGWPSSTRAASPTWAARPRSTARPIPTSAGSSRASCGRARSRWRSRACARSRSGSAPSSWPGSASSSPSSTSSARRRATSSGSTTWWPSSARWAGSSRAPPCAWPACRSAGSPTWRWQASPGAR